MTTKIKLALIGAALMVTPLAASAQSQDDQNACMNDAFSVCGHAIPDRDRVAACLAQNLNKISPACRVVMLRYSRPAPRERITTVRN